MCYTEKARKGPNRASTGNGVSFAPFPFVHLLPDSPVASAMTEEERCLSWYSQSDIGSFKDEVRVFGRCIRRQMREGDEVTDQEGETNPQQSLYAIITEQEGCTRGIETRVWPERQRKKNAAVRAVLESQNRLRYLVDSCIVNPDNNIDPTFHLCCVSRMATQWSRDVALKAGHEDFAAAYPDKELPRRTWEFIDISDFPPVKTDNMKGEESDLFEPIPIPDISFPKRRPEHSKNDSIGRSVRQKISLGDNRI